METTIEKDDSQLLLPDEITTQILFRLPAESVMRCKRVCKIWRALIADPTFINMQTSRSISYYTLNATAAETTWVIFPRKVVDGFDYQLRFVEYNNGDNGHDEDVKESKPIIYRPITFTHPTINFHPSPSIPTIKKIGSCNGLIFMTTIANNMFVCNPFTREYVDLPLRFNTPKILMDFSRGLLRMASGFGYHSSTNEYKVVIIHYKNNSYSEGQVSIYTLGSGGWRDKGEISHNVINGATGGVLFNGALHWLTAKKMDKIVSFDLADEEFRIVPSPPILISQSDDYVPQLGLLGGCLYVTRKRRRSSIDEDPAQTPTDIWVMDSMEYSWSKKFSISWKSGLSNHRPVALLESGRILLHRSNERLISYDPETESSIVAGETEFLSIYSYIKTIVSLKELGEADAMIFDPDVCESLYSDIIIESRKREAAEINNIKARYVSELNNKKIRHLRSHYREVHSSPTQRNGSKTKPNQPGSNKTPDQLVTSSSSLTPLNLPAGIDEINDINDHSI